MTGSLAGWKFSPTPVREALAHLEATGLVTREALRGYRVAPPLTAEQLDQLIDVRLLVETGALDKALKHLPQFADDLRAAHERDLEAVRRHKLTDPATRLTLEQYQEYFEADWGFHRVMLQASHNAYLERVGESLSFQVHRMRQTYQEHVLDAADAVREHEAILDAVSAGDRATALVALQGHLEAVRRRSIAGEQH